MAQQSGPENSNWRNPGGIRRQPRRQTPHNRRTRRSFGVACCRINNGRPEVLIDNKRYTYELSEFAHGKYKSNDSYEIVRLFNGMTVDEKHDILSLNFMQIWYRIWLGHAHKTTAFFAAKNKFESTFVVDGGVRLRRLISKSTNGYRIWEIPKGRKNSNAEENIHCAIREFYEETGVNKKKYRMFPDATRTYSFVDNDTRYIFTYYIAIATHNIIPRVNFSSCEQATEVYNLRWASIEEIRFLDPSGRLEQVVKPVFKYIKKHTPGIGWNVNC